MHHSGFLFRTYERQVTKLKKIIKKKWKEQKNILVFNVLLRKIKEGDEVFNPIEYFEGDHEQFFERLQE